VSERRPRYGAAVKRQARRGVDRASSWGRRLGVLPHQPERWSAERWTEAYGSGQLEYYGTLDELARYSLLVGYVGFFFPPSSERPLPRVLDVGCGTGLLRNRLGSVVGEYVGVDLSATAVESAQRRALPGTRFVVGDVASPDLGSFDVVVLNEMLYYVEDLGPFFDRLGALLEPSGLLLVSMWRHPGDRTLAAALDARFPLVDRVEARNRANQLNPRGWLVSCHRRPPVPPPQGSSEGGSHPMEDG
jgi:2-polyprenyl-6-hydroxyphenyl methylase/3-demethylubiquinone-9 3-methyltransferase